MAEQLRMIYDASCPALKVEAPAGFTVRPLQKEEHEAYFKLRTGCGFDLWDHEIIARFYEQHAIAGGIIVAVEDATGRLAASATAEYGELNDPAAPGTLGWVMTDEEFGGRGLGRAVSAAATAALFKAGLAPVYLLTDDFRTAAVALYLKMRWKPWLFQEDMPERWRKLCRELGYPESYAEEYGVGKFCKKS